MISLKKIKSKIRSLTMMRMQSKRIRIMMNSLSTNKRKMNSKSFKRVNKMLIIKIKMITKLQVKI